MTGDAPVLTEAEREALGLALTPMLDDDSAGPLEWHPCRECPNAAKDQPCPCSGSAYLGPEMATAVEAILAAHVAAERARVDAAWRARVTALAGELTHAHQYVAAGRLRALIAEETS